MHRGNVNDKHLCVGLFSEKISATWLVLAAVPK